ncbi:HAD family hydrolase [Saccharibacillus alkalitolerans]|uniref:HAD family hydrolase n=1 Tax=Saccharibacillus alkalitolerans TaxID=2705290 RepID=A0ABX0FBR7_9BACL|nr:HAD family hydrolase [Saccharibacillus alkalitolerans]NGZ76998.1 HAD family hydrolase [Saccharibacillus alkalitolerans]
MEDRKPEAGDRKSERDFDVFGADAILFDKDGTLLDFTAMWGFWSDRVLSRFRTLLAERRLGIAPEKVPQIWGTEHETSGRTIGYDKRGPLAMGTMDEVRAILIWHGYRAGLSWAEAKIAVRDCLERADEEMELVRPARLLPGVREFLERCRDLGIPTAVVTADETDSALRHLRWLGIEGYFGAVIGTDLAERGKPFPDLCLLACERLGVRPRRTVVIGDTDGDMEMARAAGAGFKIGIGEPGALKLADLTVPSFESLLESAVKR